MGKFINEKTNTISVWTNPTKEISDKFSCDQKIMVNYFISEFEKSVDGKKHTRRLEISRIFCGYKILEETTNFK